MSVVALEMKVEWSLGMRVEQSSDLPGRVEWSSGLKVEWSCKQWRQEIGCPLTSSELRVVQSSDLGAEWSLEMRVEQSSDSKSRAEWSSECPLTSLPL